MGGITRVQYGDVVVKLPDLEENVPEEHVVAYAIRDNRGEWLTNSVKVDEQVWVFLLTKVLL